MFSTLPKTNFQPNLICLLQMLSVLDQSKILSCGKEALLNHLKEGQYIQFPDSIILLTSYHDIDLPTDVNPYGVSFKYLDETV